MSEFVNNPVGKQAQDINISPRFLAYSGVIINTGAQDENGKEIIYWAGNISGDTGRVLTINNPWGSTEQAQAILNSLISSGFQYQPYRASEALLNPAAELGDAVTVNGTYSGIYKLSRNYTTLMAADIEAPQDEELDHEYPYEPKQDRIFKREIAQANAQISLTQAEIRAEVTRLEGEDTRLSTRITQNANSITSEVNRATAAEGQLSSFISQTESDIRAEVVSRKGGSSSSFSWNLTDSSWTLKSGSSTVFKAASSGVEIYGKITARSGYIGNSANGFTIGDTYILNGMTGGLNDTTHNGVYIGTDGIALGKGNFKVTASGAVTAKNLTITGGSISLGSNFKVTSAGNITANNAVLTGRLTVGGVGIDAAALRGGAQSAYSNGSSWTTGANRAAGYYNATQSGASGPNIFNCSSLFCKTLSATTSVSTPKLYINGTQASWVAKENASMVLGW